MNTPSHHSKPAGELMQLALQHHQAGRLAEAQAIYNHVLTLIPNHPDALHLSGLIAYQKGNSALAIELIGRAIGVNPGSSRFYNNLGLALRAAGNLKAAAGNFEKALAIKRDYPEACFNLGNALKELEQYPLALESYNRTIALKPDYADAYYRRGTVLQDMMQPMAALEDFDRAVALQPGHVDAYLNRGNVLWRLKQFHAAVESYDKAIEVKPDCADAYNNRGNAQRSLNQHHAALDSFGRAIALRPDYASAYANRALVLRELKQYKNALEDYDRSLALDPGQAFVCGMRLYTAMAICDWTGFDKRLGKLEEKVACGEWASPPFEFLVLSPAPALQRKAAEIWVRHEYPLNHLPALPERNAKRKKIRIGYFSADFYNHATMYLMAELFELHDKSEFEIFAFSYGPDIRDEMRLRLERAVDRFFNVSSLADEAVAEMSRDLEVDIAVDLKGFTQGGRAGIFALRAAPIQVNYLGYPGTMGAPFMDYLLADAILIPERCRQYYSEEIVYLPNCYQPNDSKRVISEKQFSRHEAGLPVSGFVYACFNNNYKITPAIFGIWMRLLRVVEDSVLWLLEDNEWAKENLLKEAANKGINPERIVFAKRVALPEHLGRHRLADLFLDTYPCNAHTTASDALWAGLPVLTLVGDAFASRVAASLLNAVDLPELVARDEEEYERLALALATQPGGMSALKDKLAANRGNVPLFNSSRYIRQIESAYVAMFERYQSGRLSSGPRCFS